MSRLGLALALVASLTTSALAHRASEPNPSTPVGNHAFAQPPIAEPVAAPRDLAIAPHLDRAAVRAQLAANRVANLARFRAYQKKGVFPSNTFANGKLNVWLDGDGKLCAAATIIQMSGRHDLVARVAVDDNFIRLADVTDGPLMDWILTSGLTQDEIAAIQEPFSRVNREPLGPQPILAVNPRLRRLEDRRLTAKYKQVDRRIVRSTDKSLDDAVARLMANPDVARRLLGVDG